MALEMLMNELDQPSAEDLNAILRKHGKTRHGSRGYSVTCSGSANNWGKCYEKAGEVCGAKGFEVIAGGSDQGAIVSGTQAGLFGGSTINRNMLIKCKP